MPTSEVEIDADKTLIKLTPVRLIATIATVVLLTSAGGARLSALASSEDVKTAITAHVDRVQPHPAIEIRLAATEAKMIEQTTKLAKLEALPRQLDGVEARLDVVIQAALDRPGRERDSMQNAARKVRRSAGVTAGASDDPLAGLSGL